MRGSRGEKLVDAWERVHWLAIERRLKRGQDEGEHAPPFDQRGFLDADVP